MRGMLAISGLALLLFSVSGLVGTSNWLAWADLGVGACATSAALLLADRHAGLRRRVAGVLALTCIAFWVAGLATPVPPWLPWLTLGFAAGLLVAAGGPVPTGKVGVPR